METRKLESQAGGPIVRTSRIAVDGGVEEVHLSIVPGGPGDFATHLRDLSAAYSHALADLDLPGSSAVLRRFFLSDAANQEAALLESAVATSDPADPVAISVVEQPPLPEARVALWAYHVHDHDVPLAKEARPGGVLLRRANRSHLWLSDPTGFAPTVPPTVERQTRSGFAALTSELRESDANLQDHLIRTWIFVDAVDRNYMGVVDERRALFHANGLTPDTHYVASTGINGRRADPQRIVHLEAYAIPGVASEQIRFLTAPEQLGPTADYGVTFERGVVIDHGDRRHLFISGTASIDPQGQVLHVGDIGAQTERTFANIRGLLSDGGAALEDMAQMIVYLRDAADRSFVAPYLEAHFPSVPYLLVLAPVCRPEWLIEIECWAVVAGGDPRWGRL